MRVICACEVSVPWYFRVKVGRIRDEVRVTLQAAPRRLIMAADSPKNITLTRNGDVWIITFQVNAITPDFLNEIHAALSKIEATPGPSAVVFASNGKIFSGGLNLKWAMEQPEASRNTAPIMIFCQLMKMMGRLVSFSIPTVGAIAGHCYAGGFMLATSLDHRILCDKGARLCLNEIKMPSALPIGATRVLTTKLGPKIIKDMLLTGRVVEAPEALATHVVDALASKEQVMSKALQLAQELAPLGENREAYGLLKRQMYGDSVALCEKAAWEYEEILCSSKLLSKL